MTWNIWIILAFIFAASELFIPTGFVLLFLGFASLITGIVVACGWGEPEWIQWIAFLFSLLGSMIVLRQPLRRSFGLDQNSQYNEFLGQDVSITTNIKAGEIGKGELQGAQWKVKNIGVQDITAGEHCKVIRVSGLTLEVSK